MRADIIKAFQWDLARQVERIDVLEGLLPRYAEWGYQELHLHLEDAVDYPSLPGVARKDAYSYRQFARLVWAATRSGIRVVPIVNLLGHTQYLIKVARLRDLNECRAADGSPLPQGQICPLHPRTLEVAEKLLRDMAPFCTAGKVHVGLDECYHLGRHPLSRAEIRSVGLAEHFARHVHRLNALTRGLGLRLALWADMLALLPAAIPRLPPGIVAYDWYYYPFRRRPLLEVRNFAPYDIAPALARAGIDYWGCAMNGAFRHEPLPIFSERLANIRSWWRRCDTVGAAGLLISSWEPSRLGLRMTTVVDAAAASLWLEPKTARPREMLERGFRRVFGERRPRACARAALGSDRFPFAGCARWEINQRWDLFTGRRDGEAYETQWPFLMNLPEQVPPGPLSASLSFRRYLAARDRFVRRAGRGVFEMRRLAAGSRRRGRNLARRIRALVSEAEAFSAELGPGRAAAKAIWTDSRSGAFAGPNEAMVGRDRERLVAWRLWLRAASRDHRLAFTASPVCGVWQLVFTVHNFAPSVQRVVVERRRSDGAWEALHGRFTIEFRALAARRRSRIRREMSVPVSDPRERLRISLRGIGQVAISGVSLTDGVRKLELRGWPPARRRLLGKSPASRGLPDFDWERNRDVWEISHLLMEKVP